MRIAASTSGTGSTSVPVGHSSSNPGASTPTMRALLFPMSSVLPMTPASPPNRRCQNPCVSTIMTGCLSARGGGWFGFAPGGT
jgi:hypothetical protein